MALSSGDGPPTDRGPPANLGFEGRPAGRHRCRRSRGFSGRPVDSKVGDRKLRMERPTEAATGSATPVGGSHHELRPRWAVTASRCCRRPVDSSKGSCQRLRSPSGRHRITPRNAGTRRHRPAHPRSPSRPRRRQGGRAVPAFPTRLALFGRAGLVLALHCSMTLDRQGRRRPPPEG
jgi:hypothetical protein